MKKTTAQRAIEMREWSLETAEIAAKLSKLAAIEAAYLDYTKALEERQDGTRAGIRLIDAVIAAVALEPGELPPLGLGLSPGVPIAPSLLTPRDGSDAIFARYDVSARQGVIRSTPADGFAPHGARPLAQLIRDSAFPVSEAPSESVRIWIADALLHLKRLAVVVNELHG